MKRFVSLFLVCMLLAAPAVAQNVRGFVSANIILRAGPDMGYPVVTVLRIGTPVYVYGCTDDWGWCDVDADNLRGWVAADFINYPYAGRTVIVHEYGPSIGIPVISFVIGTYWGSHYRDRPFYREREVWYRRPMPRRPPPTRSWYRSRDTHRETTRTRTVRPAQPPQRATERRPVQARPPGGDQHRLQPAANPRQAPARTTARPADNRRRNEDGRTRSKAKDRGHGH